jgi:hypothetical protein
MRERNFLFFQKGEKKKEKRGTERQYFTRQPLCKNKKKEKKGKK